MILGSTEELGGLTSVTEQDARKAISANKGKVRSILHVPIRTQASNVHTMCAPRTLTSSGTHSASSCTQVHKPKHWPTREQADGTYGDR